MLRNPSIDILHWKPFFYSNCSITFSRWTNTVCLLCNLASMLLASVHFPIHSPSLQRQRTFEFHICPDDNQNKWKPKWKTMNDEIKEVLQSQHGFEIWRCVLQHLLFPLQRSFIRLCNPFIFALRCHYAPNPRMHMVHSLSRNSHINLYLLIRIVRAHRSLSFGHIQFWLERMHNLCADDGVTSKPLRRPTYLHFFQLSNHD